MKRLNQPGLTRRTSALSALTIAGILLFGCGEDDPANGGTGAGGTTASGGRTGSGGSTAAGGSTGTGGSSAGTGGATAAGGATGAGGSTTAPADGGSPGDTSPVATADIVATAQAAGSFKTLVAALTAADLVSTLQGPGPFTVLAPTDAAFAKLPAGTVEDLLKPENKSKLQALLKYHVIAGRVPSTEVVKLTTAKTLEGSDVKIAVVAGQVKVNDANVTTVDVNASNGVIHVIDAVLMPASPATQAKTIVATAEAAGTFKTLVAAVKAADLVDTLNGPGPFTVFAPTDEAFAKLPAATVEGLLKPENKAMLQSILKYHVVAGKVPSTEVVKLTTAKTVEGRSVTIAVNAGKVKVNAANVTAVDVAASNGVIHVIDAVLLPQ